MQSVYYLKKISSFRDAGIYNDEDDSSKSTNQLSSLNFWKVSSFFFFFFFLFSKEKKEKKLAKTETKAIIFKIFKMILKNSGMEHSEIDSRERLPCILNTEEPKGNTRTKRF